MSPEVTVRRENIPDPAHADLEMALEFAHGMLDKDRDDDRYKLHNEDMLVLLKEHGFTSDAIKMGIALHDVVDHRLYSENERERLDAQARISEFYDGNIENWATFVYGLGYAMSARKWEDQVAESWRESAIKNLLELQFNPDSDLKFDIHELDIIQGSIEKSNHIKDISNEGVRAVLKKAKLFDLDVANISTALDELDVEGLIIKGVELVNNLKNPNKDRPASEWRDCIEVMNCYAPALELCGFDGLANELRGLALEYFYDDQGEVSKMAEQQRRLSKDLYVPLASFIDNQFDKLANIESLEGLPDLSTEAQRLGRLKSKGSLMEKLLSDKYINILPQLVSDGIGFKLVVPDSVHEAGRIPDVANALEELLTHDDIQRQFSIEGWHPIEHYRKDSVTNARDSGYQSFHLTFMCKVNDGSGVALPFEIQIVSESQDLNNKYDKPSHLFYKLGLGEHLKDNPEMLAHMQQLRSRADFIKAKPDQPTFHPNTWSELLRILPNMDTPLHHVFSTFSIDGSAQVLGPKELSVLGFDLQGGEATENVFLPAAQLTREQFLDCIMLLDSSLSGNEAIGKALDLLESKRGQIKPRQSGDSTIEAHLLPAALQAALLATVSAERWDNAEDPDFMVTRIVAALLHDVVEDTHLGIESIREEFGPNVAGVVKGITKVPKVPGQTKLQRRVVYKHQLKDHPQSLPIKCADRGSNHTSDLIKMIKGKVMPGEEDKIEYYNNETDEDLMPLFEAHLSADYIRSMQVLRQIYNHLKFIYSVGKVPGILPKNGVS